MGAAKLVMDVTLRFTQYLGEMRMTCNITFTSS
jgi:hypothetical protein